MQLLTGNADADGKQFRGWFIGALSNWSREVRAFGLRESQIVEVKWSGHPAGDARTEWAACDSRTMSLLVRGKFLLRFRFPQDRGAITEQRLVREGDYAIWGAGVEHTWLVEEDAVILTVRWRE